MSESPFMPQQPNQVKAPLLVGTVILGIGMFLFSYIKWESILVSLGLTAASTGLLYFLLKGFLMKRTQPRYGNRDFDPKRRRK
jgi:protein-S-isoprenylcysteine O-methyltransferase Ste14